MKSKLYGSILMILAALTTGVIVIAFVKSFNARYFNFWYFWCGLASLFFVYAIIFISQHVCSINKFAIVSIGYVVIAMEILFLLANFINPRDPRLAIILWFAWIATQGITYLSIYFLLGLGCGLSDES